MREDIDENANRVAHSELFAKGTDGSLECGAKSATTIVEKELVLKWILRMPQGLLHSPTRGGEYGTRHYKEIARRFVLSMHRDMVGLIKIWQQACIAAQNKLSHKEAEIKKWGRAWIDKATRLLGKGVIS